MAASSSSVPSLGFRGSAAVWSRVVLPTLAKGVIRRRPAVVALAARVDTDRRAVVTLQRVRHDAAPGPLLIGAARGRRWAVVLEPAHVQRVLDGTPEPFAIATPDKRTALGHFEPHASLVSLGAARETRRRFNDDVLESSRPTHSLAAGFLAVIEQEANRLIPRTSHRTRLVWGGLADAWFRFVRRLVFGETARDDRALSTLMARLRSHANWAWLWPRDERAHAELVGRVRHHLSHAEPGTLGAHIAELGAPPGTAVEDQVAHWLFAFDAAAIATFRTLALLATHPRELDRAGDPAYLRGCVLDAVRLWPTTPLILRETTSDTVWEDGRLPAGTTLVIYAPFFHRDDERLPFANRFAPEVWLDERRARRWPLVPFSLGPAICPGRHLVLLVASAWLSHLLAGRTCTLTGGAHLDPFHRLPGTLDPYSLAFELRR